MDVSAKFTGPGEGILTIDGQDWIGPLPPEDGYLKAVYEEWLLSGNAPEPWAEPEPEEPEIRVYKADLFRKMTDGEYAAYIVIRQAFTPRLQAIFDQAEYLSSKDEFWPALLTAAKDAYGTDRAHELLNVPTIAL